MSLTNALAFAFLKKNDSAQALEILKTLPLQRHTLTTQLQESLFLRSVTHYQLHQVSSAISDIDRLYALNPSYPNLDDVKGKMSGGTYDLTGIHISVGA